MWGIFGGFANLNLLTKVFVTMDNEALRNDFEIFEKFRKCFVNITEELEYTDGKRVLKEFWNM